ncbi:hypothetical protein CARUB_v10021560mg, partial [Capsella rubella]
MNDDNRPRCPLSHPTHHPHTLSPRSNPDLRFGCATCCGQKAIMEQSPHFYCTTCNVEFHNGCQRRTRKITHPYHLQHPLTLSYRNPETGIMFNSNVDSGETQSNTSDRGKSESLDIIWSQADSIFDECTWCGKDFKDGWFYHCSICTFCLDLSCAAVSPPLAIPNPKSHQHSLLLFPRPVPVPCDACGLIKAFEPIYACFQCNYMVHHNCMDLPRVIKITKVDNKYGKYSCRHEECSYVVHSKCATHENIWDGRELEWKIEESDDTEDIIPFKRVGDDLIKYFGHQHCLRLQEYDCVRDAEKQCQACVFPIDSQHFYHCTTCDFFLHEVCANLPRKLDHALHNHRLILDPSSPKDFKSIYCSVCSRASTGFRYKCSEIDCQKGAKFAVDILMHF